MKKLIALTLMTTLMTTLMGCALGGNTISPLDDIMGIDPPREIYIRYTLKRTQYMLIPWDYTMVERCGWVYDEWMGDFEGMNACNRTCIERDRWETRPTLYPTFERCMYYNHQLNNL